MRLDEVRDLVAQLTGKAPMWSYYPDGSCRPSFGAPIPMPTVPGPVYSSSPIKSLPFTPLSPNAPMQVNPIISLPYTPQCAIEANIPFRLRASIVTALQGGGSPVEYALMSKLAARLGFPLAAACLQKMSGPDASGNYP